MHVGAVAQCLYDQRQRILNDHNIHQLPILGQEDQDRDPRAGYIYRDVLMGGSLGRFSIRVLPAADLASGLKPNMWN